MTQLYDNWVYWHIKKRRFAPTRRDLAIGAVAHSKPASMSRRARFVTKGQLHEAPSRAQGGPPNVSLTGESHSYGLSQLRGRGVAPARQTTAGGDLRLAPTQVTEDSEFWRASNRLVLKLDNFRERASASAGVEDPVAEVNTAGMTLHPMTVAQIVNEIVLRAVTGDRLLLANHNLHSLRLMQINPTLREFYAKADRTIIDGAPILWLAKRHDSSLGPQHRVGSTDWLGALLHVANESGMKVALLGGEPGVAETAKNEICERFENVTVSVRDGYFDSTTGSNDSEDTLDWLRAFAPDILLVGMGMPRQELWVSENYDRIAATVTCTVGGCLDYIGGAQRLAPRWLGRFGLEWAYRLVVDPSRLWHRYLVEAPTVIISLLASKLTVRR